MFNFSLQHEMGQALDGHRISFPVNHVHLLYSHANISHLYLYLNFWTTKKHMLFPGHFQRLRCIRRIRFCWFRGLLSDTALKDCLANLLENTFSWMILRWKRSDLDYRNMDVSENSGFSSQIIHFNRVFHYKPSILGYPRFWKHPYEYGLLPELLLEEILLQLRLAVYPRYLQGFIRVGWLFGISSINSMNVDCSQK